MNKTKQGERALAVCTAIARAQAPRPGLPNIRAGPSGPLKPYMGARLGSAYARLGLRA